MLLGYIRRHHIGLLALFVALGGTSYAAVKLPKNSVGTAQIKNHAVTTAKLSTTTVKALKGAKGDRGPAGDTGATGAKGDPGAPATLSAAVSALTGASGPASTVPAASVTLQKAGKILVVVTGTFAVTCGGADCSYEVGAKLDGGAPISGTTTTVSATAGNASSRAVAIAGMVSADAGAHQVQLYGTPTAGATASSVSTDTRVVAIAIG